MFLFYALTAFGLGFWVGGRALTARPRVPAPHEWDAFGQARTRRVPAVPDRSGIARSFPVQSARDRTMPDSPGRIYLHSAS